MLLRLSRAFATTILLSLVTSGCGSTTVTQVAGPTEVRCQTSFGSSSTSVTPSGGQVNVNVSAARECGWNAASEASWIQVAPSSGQGDGALTLTIAANRVPQTRSSAVVVNSQRFAVTQDAAPCTFSLSSRSASVQYQGGNASVGVSTLDGCAWTATGGEHWTRIETPTGNGNGTVTIRAEANTAGQRSATMTIAGLPFTITQSAFVPPPPPPPSPTPAPAPSPTPSPTPSPSPTPTPTPTPTPSPTPTPTPAPTPSPTPSPSPGPPATTCTYTIAPAAQGFSRRGGDGSFAITTASGCSWTASTGADWIDLRSSSGTGSGTVRYDVERNRTSSVRSAAITAGGQTHTVTQFPGNEGD